MITIKLAIAIIAFLLSSGQIVFQTFRHHHVINPRRGFIKFMVFIVSSLSLVYLAKDIYADFDNEKPAAIATNSVEIQAEIDYWHNVDKSAAPEGYCDYLEKYPDGQFVGIAKHRVYGDCEQVKLQAQAELKATLEAELKAKLDNETKALAEKNVQLEKEVKDNAAKLADLTQAKTPVESNPQPESAAQMQLEAELKATFESETSAPPATQVPASEMQAGTEVKPKPELKADESLF